MINNSFDNFSFKFLPYLCSLNSSDDILVVSEFPQEIIQLGAYNPVTACGATVIPTQLATN